MHPAIVFFATSFFTPYAVLFRSQFSPRPSQRFSELSDPVWEVRRGVRRVEKAWEWELRNPAKHIPRQIYRHPTKRQRVED